MKTNKLNNRIEHFLDTVMEEYDLPGIAVGVSVGEESAAAARGFKDYTKRKSPKGTPELADIEPSSRLAADDIFHCASVSKLFTSTAIMKLVEAGVLNLYDRLCNLLPGLCIADKRYKEIKLWNMLTHTSGLGDVSDYHWGTPLTGDGSLREYVYGNTECVNQAMLWDPQTTPEFYDMEACENSMFRYSNVAYEMLGQIVAEYSCKMPGCSGLSYEDFVAEYLFKPAGMHNSTMKTYDRSGWASEPSEMTACNMAFPHERMDDRSIALSEHYPYTRQHAPSSTLTSNVSDLLSWGRAHLNSSRILQSETYDSIWRNYSTVPNNGEKMGLGWFMRKQAVTGSDGCKREYLLYGHEGTDDGFRASFWICPEFDMVTVILSNLSGAPVKKINKKMFEAVVR